MARRDDSYIAAFQTADEDSKTYAVQCASGTMAYLDAPSGYYDCFAPGGLSGEHFRWTYISVGATLAPSSLPAPTAATSAQTPLVGGMAPANASFIRLYVPPNKRLAILYSTTGPTTLYCVKVL